MHSMKIKEGRTGSLSSRYSGGGVRAVKLALCAALLAAAAGAQPAADWTITTIAGTGEYGFNGDGGLAIDAQIRRARGVALDGAGNLYIADTSNHRIRKVDSWGTITTFVGRSQPGVSGGGFSGDGGPAIEGRLNNPRGVALDGEGNLFIADTWNHRIRKVDSSGTITTFVGWGRTRLSGGGFNGDGGLAVDAQLQLPL